ncbi:hypothetical protein VPNG_07690 [Cytospora leucostoma]|uniref:Uncharacterized protein n=1 Tax=Cytospora leucostoma TaxID=1230097 RepID=A0A423WFP0_9PEZI|nr:hypothetical protein VPNG_07690 [Cytospora leucostoma]
MSSDSPNSTNSNNTNNKPASPPPTDMHRRGSVTSAAFTSLFQRSNSTATGTPVFPSAITTAALSEQRRKMSLTTSSLGLSGTSPTSNASFARRASLSTNNSDSVDENAIEEEDYAYTSRTAPINTFGSRRMSLGASPAMRRPGGSSPGTSNGMPTAQFPDVTLSPSTQPRGTDATPSIPTDNAAAAVSATSRKLESSPTAQTNPANASNTNRPRAVSNFISQKDQGFNWSEQLRSRAESTVASGQRPSFSLASGLNGSPPRVGAFASGGHDRARSVSEMPAPPAQAPKSRTPPRDSRPKPDHFQERILKGDFYMD